MIRNFIPDKEANSTKKQLNFIRSEDKNRSVWQYLKRYENANFVYKKLSAQYPSIATSLKKQKSQHIADCVRQSEAYFNTANKSDLAIKPLILYYGMLNLVKALIFFGDNPYTLEADVLKSEGLNQHGLTIATRDTDDAKIRNNLTELLEEHCYVTSGKGSVFSLLHQCWSKPNLLKNMRFNVGELASMHPSSWYSYATYTGDSPKYFPVESSFRTTSEGYEQFMMFKGDFQFLTYQNVIPVGEEGNRFFESNMPRLASQYNRDNVYSPYSYRTKQIPSSLEEYQATYRSATGGTFTMADPNAGVPLHLIEVEFIMMFILGSLTRYAPHKWLKNVLYEGGDAMFVIEGFINSVSLSFPKLILEEFDNEPYTFTGDSSYWG